MSIINGFSNQKPIQFTEAVDRYNIPTVTYEKIYTDYEQNYIPTMTADTTGNFTALASGYQSDSSIKGEKYKAFDGNTSTMWQRDSYGSYFTAGSWLGIKLDTTIKINEISIYRGRTNNVVSGLTIQTSTDGSSWTDVTTASFPSTSTSDDLIIVDLTNYNLETRYIRLYFTSMQSIGGDYYVPSIKEFQITKYSTYVENYVNHLSLNFGECEKNKIINMQGVAYNSKTSFANPYLEINDLERKQISGTIKSGSFHTLVYNGTNWVVKNTL